MSDVSAKTRAVWGVSKCENSMSDTPIQSRAVWDVSWGGSDLI